jgi:hypothetical protein
MDISPTDAAGTEYAVRVEKLAQNTARIQGEAAVQLIEGAQVPPPGPNGEGTHINTYA